MNVKDLAKRAGLKERLDRIAEDGSKRVQKGMEEGLVSGRHCQWRMGREVLKAYPELEAPAPGGGGVGAGGVGAGFSEVERLTGRKRETLSKWVKLVLEHPEEKEFLQSARVWAHSKFLRWLGANLLPSPKPQAPALPSDKYRVIYADPPWKYSDKLIEGYGAAEHHYPPMSIEELCNPQFAELAGDNAVLFLWVTSPFLEDCFAVIRAWGFDYKSSFVWDKVKHNFGHYNSVRHELLLVCTRGSCTPDVATLIDSVQQIERSEKHSEKPEEFRTIIDSLYPNGKRIELFSRAQHPGWDAWGNEVAA